MCRWLGKTTALCLLSCFMQSSSLTSTRATKRNERVHKQKFLPWITNPANAQFISQSLRQTVPLLTDDVVKPGVGRKIVDESKKGMMPIMCGEHKRMATVNLALMALNYPGDFVETGVYTGSTAVLLAKVLQGPWGGNDRRLWAADSFQGMPEEDPEETARQQDMTQDHVDLAWNGRVANRIGAPGLFATTRETFEKNLEANGVGNSTTNPQIKILHGWFSETLPLAPIRKISFLRLDGSMYKSTMDALNNLYDKVSPGGIIYVDSYGSDAGCHHAIDDFRSVHSISDIMYPIYENGSSGGYDAVWWQKRMR